MKLQHINDSEEKLKLPIQHEPESKVNGENLDSIRDVQAVVDIFRRQRPLKKSGVVMLWKLAAPFCALGVFGGMTSGDLAMLISSGFLLATSLKISKLDSGLDISLRAWKTHEIDGKWIGALGEALLWPDKRIRKQASLTLTRLLSQMDEQEACLVTPEQRTGLLQHINLKTWKHDPDLVLALIRGVELWKDPHALPALYEIAARKTLKYPQKYLIEDLRSLIIRLERTFLEEGVTVKSVHAAVAIESENIQKSAAPLFSPEVLERINKLNEATQERHPGMRLGFLLATWLIIVPYTGYETVLNLLGRSPIPAVCFFITMLCSTQFYRFTLTKKQSEAAYKLALTEDKNAVGSLAETLDWPDPELSGVAARALSNLLPRLNASDSHLLNDAQRQSLYRRLKMSVAVQNQSFTLALLKALEQIGDMTAIPFVQQLSESTSNSHNESRIREAAIQCLPFLKICAESTRNTQTLLRASSAENTPQEMLLRPVLNSIEPFPDQLLRAVSVQEEL